MNISDIRDAIVKNGVSQEWYEFALDVIKQYDYSNGYKYNSNHIGDYAYYCRITKYLGNPSIFVHPNFLYKLYDKISDPWHESNNGIDYLHAFGYKFIQNYGVPEGCFITFFEEDKNYILNEINKRQLLNKNMKVKSVEFNKLDFFYESSKDLLGVLDILFELDDKLYIVKNGKSVEFTQAVLEQYIEKFCKEKLLIEIYNNENFMNIISKIDIIKGLKLEDDSEFSIEEMFN